VPLPAAMLAALTAARLDWGVHAPSAPDSGWVIPAWSPGEAPTDPDAARTGLEKRLRQSGRQWLPLTLTVGGESIPAVATPELSRAGAVKLGYKLKIWSVLRLAGGATSPVYTGINSRMR